MNDNRQDLHRGDARSVGELLLDADLHARSALWDPSPDQAKARVRAWGELVDAAAQAWSTIPDRDQDLTMEQIHVRASKQNARWPGGGDGDPLLETAAASLTRAAELVGGRRHPTAPLTEAGHLDAEAARTRLMHTVYAASHAVALSLDHHIRDLHRLREAGRAVPAGDSIVHARSARDRATAVERLAGIYLETRWPAALAGQRQERAEGVRLEQATARWDLYAHRVLAHNPTTANLEMVVQVQTELGIATSVVNAAAAHAGDLDMQTYRGRLAPATAEVERAWGQLGADMRLLMGRDRQRDPELLLAANELRAALYEITHDRTGLASPSAIAARTDLAATTRALQCSVAAVPDIAHAVREAVQEVRLTAAARGAHAVATNHLGEDVATPWVNPADLAQRREIALPQPVRAVLVDHAERVIDAARVADSCASARQAPKVAAGTAPSGSRPVDGRRHQDRTPLVVSSPAPGFGCER